jgi:hypothetical protein
LESPDNEHREGANSVRPFYDAQRPPARELSRAASGMNCRMLRFRSSGREQAHLCRGVETRACPLRQLQEAAGGCFRIYRMPSMPRFRLGGCDRRHKLPHHFLDTRCSSRQIVGGPRNALILAIGGRSLRLRRCVDRGHSPTGDGGRRARQPAIAKCEFWVAI